MGVNFWGDLAPRVKELAGFFLLLLLLSHFSRVRLCATPQMAAHQAPPSLGFSRQEHWSWLPFPSPPTSSTIIQSTNAGIMWETDIKITEQNHISEGFSEIECVKPLEQYLA